MSRPCSPIQFSVYKIMREYEKTGKTIYFKDELNQYATKCLKVASEIDNEDYWVLDYRDFDDNSSDKLSNICDETLSCFEVNPTKMQKGGMVWAKRMIGAMKYSFLKASLSVLNEEIKEKQLVGENNAISNTTC